MVLSWIRMYKKEKKSLTMLPCYPCPHASNCCSWGTDLSSTEAAELAAKFGNNKVILMEGGYRTAVINGVCSFLVNNSCSIHEHPYYPAVCAAFPDFDVDGGEYMGDRTICPELK